MNVQHINIKFYLKNPQKVNLGDYSAVFNAWIQKQALDELLIDTADYLHVHNGPGLLLIGYEADYSLDNRAGRLGLLYNRKAPLEGTTQEKLAQAARAVLTAAQKLEKENGLKFDGQEAQIIINDRLLVPNTAKSYAALEPDLAAFLNGFYNGAGYHLSQAADSRERFTVNVKTETAFTVDALLKNLPLPEKVAHA